MWNALAPELWRYTTTYLDPTLARLVGATAAELRRLVRASYAKVAEFQRRGMERIGHTSPAVALRYQHVMADRQHAIAAALDGLVRDAQQPAGRAPRARRGHGEPRRGSGGKAAGS